MCKIAAELKMDSKTVKMTCITIWDMNIHQKTKTKTSQGSWWLEKWRKCIGASRFMVPSLKCSLMRKSAQRKLFWTTKINSTLCNQHLKSRIPSVSNCQTRSRSLMPRPLIGKRWPNFSTRLEKAGRLLPSSEVSCLTTTQGKLSRGQLYGDLGDSSQSNRQEGVNWTQKVCLHLYGILWYDTCFHWFSFVTLKFCLI